MAHDSDGQEDVDFEDAIDSTKAEVGEDQDDRSSSLSDPEDDNEDVEEQNGIEEDILDGGELAAQRSLEVDSEAETERLDQTPQKLRKHADSLGRTPSKLSQAATAEEDLSEPPSPLLVGAGAASSTSTVATVGESNGELNELSSSRRSTDRLICVKAGQKRKRSDTAVSSLSSADSDLGESPRKRSHSSREEVPFEEQHIIEAIAETVEAIEAAEEAPLPEDSGTASAMPAKGPKGKKGKFKGKKHKELVAAAGEISVAEPEVVEEPEPQEEQSEENRVKTEEELKVKKEASTLYDDVAKQFRNFKERLYNERLTALTAELQLLQQPNCAHPEYVRQIACVDTRLQKQLSEARAYYSYRLRCIRDRVLGDRSQLHSQYYQHIRDLRENALEKLGEEWYAIQKERRQSHQERDDAYIFKFPAKKSAQIRQQAKYNQEVSVLSGVAKYVGFPAAPEIDGTATDSFEEDMKAMKISKRATRTVAQPDRPVFLHGPTTAPFSTNERLAHEQFIEQNAWARPQAPIHAHGTTPGISHTPDWAEPTATGRNPSAKHLIRNLSGQTPRASSPFTTPMPQKRVAGDLSSSGTVPMNSDPTEAVPSSVLAAPPTTERISLLHQGGSSNQASPITIPKHRQNGTELTGFRNISNISGISGISGVSTIDAPSELADRDRDQVIKPSVLPTLTAQASAPQQIFDTSQLHRHPDEKREVYANIGFRPQQGEFGTPAPLPASTTAQ